MGVENFCLFINKAIKKRKIVRSIRQDGHTTEKGRTNIIEKWAEEVLSFENTEVKQGNLFVANALLTAFHGVSNNSQVEEAIYKFTSTVTGKEVNECPVNIPVWEKLFPDKSPFLLEVSGLRHAVEWWLHKGHKPKVNINALFAVLFDGRDLDVREGLAVDALLFRSKQFYARPAMSGNDLFDGELITLYAADSLIPLAWAEVWYAVEHRLPFGLCPFCSGIYLIPNSAPFKSFCGGSKCRREKIIQDHGGIEGYRQWERDRKIKNSGKRGRPKKPVD